MKYYISHLRNLATFCVILLHASSTLVKNFEKIQIETWTAANFIDSCTRFCVPIFVMISGALLLKSSDSLFQFLNKRMKRIIIPLLFWSIIYFGWRIHWEEISLDRISLIKYTENSIIRGASYHLWYLYMIIGLYLFIPIIKPFVQKAKKRELEFFLGIWLLTLLLTYIPNKPYPNIELMYFSNYLGYLILGFYLDQFFSPTSKNRWFGLFLFLIGLGITFFGTQILSLRINNFDKTLFHYLTFNVALMSAGIFLFFKTVKAKTTPLLSLLDKNSFGIYFVHAMLLSVILNWIPYSSFEESVISAVLYILSIALLNLIISFIFIFLGSKIPILKKVIQ